MIMLGKYKQGEVWMEGAGGVPAMWETATMIMLGKYKQGEVWMEGAGGVPCLEVCRNVKY